MTFSFFMKLTILGDTRFFVILSLFRAGIFIFEIFCSKKMLSESAFQSFQKNYKGTVIYSAYRDLYFFIIQTFRRYCSQVGLVFRCEFYWGLLKPPRSEIWKTDTGKRYYGKKIQTKLSFRRSWMVFVVTFLKMPRVRFTKVPRFNLHVFLYVLQKTEIQSGVKFV